MSTTKTTALPLFKRGEVLVAIIGLIGVLSTGVLSNWDKLFNNVVQAKSFYRPTDNFEMELRHFSADSGKPYDRVHGTTKR